MLNIIKLEFNDTLVPFHIYIVAKNVLKILLVFCLICKCFVTPKR